MRNILCRHTVHPLGEPVQRFPQSQAILAQGAFFVLRSRWFACVRHGPVRQMSQQRRSARLRGESAEHQGLDDHGVPVVDLTVVWRMEFSTSVRVVTGRYIVSVPLIGR